MAKPIVVNYLGQTTNFDHKKLSRKELYGRRKREVVDRNGVACRRAALTDDGRFLLVSGMTAQGYFTDSGRWVPNKELVGLDEDGQQVDSVPSTLGVEQQLEQATTADLLDLQVASVYRLKAEHIDDGLAKQLDAGILFRCPFNYRADYYAETLIILKNEHGVFGLVGIPTPTEWTDAATVQPAVADGSDDLFEDDLDFEMF